MSTLQKMMELSTLNLDLLGLGSPNHNNLYNELFHESCNQQDDITRGTTPQGGAALSSINNSDWLEDVASPFRELDDIQEVRSPSVSEEFCMDSTQNLIDEVEQFLVHHENKHETAKKIEQQDQQQLVFDESMLPRVNDSLTSNDSGLNSIILDSQMEEEDQQLDDESENKMAIDVLEALMNGNITTSSPVPSSEAVEIKQEAKDDLIVDYSKLTNVSEFVLEDGRNVIIMIADGPSNNKSASSSSLPIQSSTIDLASLGHILGSNSIAPSSPSNSSIDSSVDGRSSPSSSIIPSDDDADWSPSPSTSSRRSSTVSKKYVEIPTTGRRGVAKTKRAKTVILDKKERKKWQNVEAARRYRDKKKIEQVETELEIKMLEDKNSNLKDKLKEMENEASTLKKLMNELGLIKTSD
jgi:hypothetical protein